jgi:hypothetical protein
LSSVLILVVLLNLGFPCPWANSALELRTREESLLEPRLSFSFLTTVSGVPESRK